MNEIIIREFEDTKVEMAEINGEPMFEIYSTGMALGYVNVAKEKAYPHKVRIENIIANAEIQPVVHGVQRYISESQLYDFMLESKTEKVKPFRKWITNEVLPTIRKTGGYVSNDELFISTYLPNADEQTKLLFQTTLSTVRNLNSKLEEQKPLVEFANTVTKSCDNILMRDMAKLLCDQHINIGEKKLYKLLREHDVLMRGNDPYQSYIDRGYFYVKEQPYSTPYGEKLNRTTLVTPKGQIWIVSKAKEWLKAS